MNTTSKLPKDIPAILSFSEKRELLSPQGIAVSRVADILWLKTITISTSLKKIWMKNHFSEPPPKGTTRIIVLVSAWVRALLKQLRPDIPKKSVESKNISPIKPREPGILFADFEKEFRNTTRVNLSLMPAWGYLTQNYPSFFSIVKSRSSGKPIYQLKEVYKEDAIRLAKDHIQRGNSPAIKRRASA